jgi:serine/threonine protein phosphatase PrpC
VLESLHAALASGTPGKGAIDEQLESAVLRANQQVLEAARSDNRKGMAATLTALFVRGDEAYIAEVGDSRAYLLRKGRLRQITRDQSLVQLLVDQGVMSAEEARTSASKNVILQAVGLRPDVRVAIARLELRRGDRVLLCSDGVSNAISDAEIQQIITQSDPRAACQTMIDLANDRGGDDNQTAIVADLVGDGLPLPDEFESVTETYEVLQAYDSPAPSSAAPPRRRPVTKPNRATAATGAELAPAQAAAPAPPQPAETPPPAETPQPAETPREVAYPPAPRTARVGTVIALVVIIVALIAIALLVV